MQDQWIKWHGYFTAVVWGGGLTAFVAFWVISVLGAVLPTSLIEPVGIGIGIVLGLSVFPLLALHVVTLYAYYQDAQSLAESGSEYQPRYILWIVGHLFAGIFVAPYYLYRRNQRIGNDYAGTHLDKLPTLGKRLIFASPQN